MYMKKVDIWRGDESKSIYIYIYIVYISIAYKYFYIYFAGSIGPSEFASCKVEIEL